MPGIYVSTYGFAIKHVELHQCNGGNVLNPTFLDLFGSHVLAVGACDPLLFTIVNR